MPSSAILDVAIGVAFVYLFFSMICSVVNEGIAALLASRAKNLVAGISSLFSESEVSAGKQFVQEIYQHGLVRGLYKDPPGNKLPDVLELVKKTTNVNLPAYIPSRTFSIALLDILDPSDGKAVHVLQNIRDNISKLPESAAKDALVSLAANTGIELSDFQNKLEDWYNDSMERAASWYKRKTQIVLLALGLVVAVGMNVDSIRIALTLWNNPIARQAAVDVAQKYIEKNPVQTSGKGDDFQKIKDEANTLTSVSQTLPVPFGWQSEIETNSNSFGNIGFWSKKAIGWFVTALALSLGAPFWFDMLNKFMMVRSSVKPKGEKKDS